MDEQSSPITQVLTKRRSVPLLEPLRSYMAKLSAGDKLIAGILGALVIGSSLVGLYALERSFLVEQPAYGDSLTEGVLGSPRFVNPLLAITDADRDLTTLTYAGLMGVDGSGKPVPVLAESYTVSDDGKTYTFTLRTGVKFSDGTPVTSADVVFTVQKAQDPALKSPELANWSNILAEAVDARTVRFTLPKAYAPFLTDATLGILPEHLWKNVTDDQFAFSPLMQTPVGTGPFVVSSIRRTKDGIVQGYDLKAFSGYALGRAYLDALHLNFFAEASDLEKALARGTIESAYGIPGKNTLRVPYSRVFGVFWNQAQNPVFARPEVRKALSLALDRSSIVNDTLGGYATAVEGPVPPGSGIDVSVKDGAYAEQLAEASSTLVKVGWKFDDTSKTWKNTKAKLELTVTLKTSNVTELKAIAGAAKAQWEAFGVPTSLQFYEPGDLTISVIRPRKFDALLFGMVVGREHDLFAFWDSSQRNDPGLNVSMYANKAVDDLLKVARSETDPQKEADDLSKLNSLISADYPAAFIDAPDFLYTLPKNMQGVSIDQIAAPSDRFANITSWYRRSELVWPFFARNKSE